MSLLQNTAVALDASHYGQYRVGSSIQGSESFEATSTLSHATAVQHTMREAPVEESPGTM